MACSAGRTRVVVEGPPGPLSARRGSDVWKRLLALVQERGVQPGMTFLHGTNIRAPQKALGDAEKRMLRRNGIQVKRLKHDEAVMLSLVYERTIYRSIEIGKRLNLS